MRRRRSTRHRHSGHTAANRAAGPNTGAASRQGLVIANYGMQLAVRDDDHTLWTCTRRKSVDTVVAGDRVVWQPLGAGSGVVTARLERRSVLTRATGSGTAKPVAANIDQLIVVTAVSPAGDRNLIDRYLAAAELMGTGAVIVLNKIDMLDDAQRRDLLDSLGAYRNAGYRVIASSALPSPDVQDLAAVLAHRTSVFVGQSGVGKSSLIGALLPDREIRTAALSAVDHGRHTTTTATLYELPSGGSIIDSPGIREFHLEAVEPVALERGFVEFADYRGRCRFNNCLHDAEIGCAVKEAVAAAHIDRRRYRSYLKILAELRGDAASGRGKR